MAGRILSVRQRTLRAIRDHLAGITRANGYEFDVRRVTTPASIWIPGTKISDPPEIHVIPGRVREIKRNVGQYWGMLPIKTMLFLRWRTEDADLEMDMFKSQVQRRVLEGMSDDSAAGLHHPIELDSAAGFDYQRFLDFPQSVGVLVGVFGFEVKYSYLSNDDRKWSTDDLHVSV